MLQYCHHEYRLQYCPTITVKITIKSQIITTKVSVLAGVEVIVRRYGTHVDTGYVFDVDEDVDNKQKKRQKSAARGMTTNRYCNDRFLLSLLSFFTFYFCRTVHYMQGDSCRRQVWHTFLSLAVQVRR